MVSPSFAAMVRVRHFVFRNLVLINSIKCFVVIWNRLLCFTPFSSTAMSACLAPRVEILTLLACMDKKPEYMRHDDGQLPGPGDGVTIGPGWTSGSGSKLVNLNLLGSPTTYVPDYAVLSPRTIPMPVAADTIFGSAWSALGAHNSSFDFDPLSINPEFEIAESKISKCSADPVVEAATSKIILGQSGNSFP